MKAIIVVFFISLLLDQQHALTEKEIETEKETEKEKETGKEICISKTGINPDDKYLNEERFYTHYACRLMVINIMHEDGSLNSETMKQIYPQLEDQHHFKQIIKDCHLYNEKILWKMGKNIMQCESLKNLKMRQ